MRFLFLAIVLVGNTYADNQSRSDNISEIGYEHSSYKDPIATVHDQSTFEDPSELVSTQLTVLEPLVSTGNQDIVYPNYSDPPNDVEEEDNDDDDNDGEDPEPAFGEEIQPLLDGQYHRSWEPSSDDKEARDTNNNTDIKYEAMLDQYRILYDIIPQLEDADSSALISNQDNSSAWRNSHSRNNSSNCRSSEDDSSSVCRKGENDSLARNSSKDDSDGSEVPEEFR